MASSKAWEALNNVASPNISLSRISGGTIDKGSGYVAMKDGTAESLNPLITVPRDLVLDTEAVELYAKQDVNFRQLLDTVGHKSPRHTIVLFLFTMLAIHAKQQDGQALSLVRVPWADYVEYLPGMDDVPVPTMWTDDDREFLKGTSLEPAVSAKLASLQSEFNELRDKSSDLPFWMAAFWLNSPMRLYQWIYSDALYRSRCLELPGIGSAMVPIIDMVNHDTVPNAYYEAVPGPDGGSVVLLVRPGVAVGKGDEITISYTGAGGQPDGQSDGQSVDCASEAQGGKSAAEMLFSYGFMDHSASSRRIALPVHPLADDPLAKAKVHMFGGATQQVTIERIDTMTAHDEDGVDYDSANEHEGTENAAAAAQVKWSCPFAYLACVNEEDGLEFQVLQATDGSTALRMFWQGEDVTDNIRDFEALALKHELGPVLQLRVVSVLQEAVESQLERLQEIEASLVGTELGQSARLDQCRVLRNLESRILSGALEALEAERSSLLSNETVLAYLGSMEEASGDDGGEDHEMDDDAEDDFS